jgi:hypothetical protein
MSTDEARDKVRAEISAELAEQRLERAVSAARWMAAASGQRVRSDFPIGVKEIAALLTERGYPVKAGTVNMWAKEPRALLPAEDGWISGRRYWWTSTILRWAVETGRLPAELNGHELEEHR